MYSSISGLKNYQMKLDVIGNNIANVNTYGFKKSRVTFKDLVNQEISGASEANNGRGGVNVKQIGLGTQIGTIDTIHTQGSLQTTGRILDLAINGDGYFVVSRGNDEGDGYMRAGNFYLDADGNIVNGDGYYLKAEGTDNPIQIPDSAKSFSIGKDGEVTYVDEDGEMQSTNRRIAVAKFSNNEGLKKLGEGLFEATANSGNADERVPGTEGTGTIVSGALEMSNVDLSEEFTEMIVAQRGFQANTRIISTSDQILEELANLKR
jgi:flagellar hook protein FlgE